MIGAGRCPGRVCSSLINSSMPQPTVSSCIILLCVEPKKIKMIEYSFFHFWASIYFEKRTEKFWSLLTKQDFLLSSKKFCSELNLQYRNVATCSWFWTSLFIASSWKVRKCKQYALCFKFVHSPGNICSFCNWYFQRFMRANQYVKEVANKKF